MDEDVALARLEGRLGHVFQRRDALRTALTHRSWAHEHAAREGQGEGPQSYNERLDSELETTVWNTGCASWYFDASGRNAAIWPDWTWRFRRRTARFDPQRYTAGRSAA